MEESNPIRKGSEQVLAHNQGLDYGMENNSNIVIVDLAENTNRVDLGQKKILKG